MENSVLCWGNDADIKCHPSSLDPIGNLDVCWSRLRVGDEARHLLHRVEGRMLRLPENIVPNSVMSATFEPVIVVAVHCMVAVDVILLVTRDR